MSSQIDPDFNAHSKLHALFFNCCFAQLSYRMNAKKPKLYILQKNFRPNVEKWGYRNEVHFEPICSSEIHPKSRSIENSHLDRLYLFW